MITAIIPARRGSKRFTNKNFRMFCGKPLITWTIEEALKSVYIDKIIISTDMRSAIYDNPKVEIYRRPGWLTGDNTPMDEVVNDLRDKGKAVGTIVILQPTSPLRDVKLINDGIRLFLTYERTVISVNHFTYEPNGAIYVYNTKNIYDGPFQFMEMSGKASIDIDYEYQFKIAESIMNDRLRGYE